jgi:hypothetical protein
VCKKRAKNKNKQTQRSINMVTCQNCGKEILFGEDAVKITYGIKGSTAVLINPKTDWFHANHEISIRKKV